MFAGPCSGPARAVSQMHVPGEREPHKLFPTAIIPCLALRWAAHLELIHGSLQRLPQLLADFGPHLLIGWHARRGRLHVVQYR